MRPTTIADVRKLGLVPSVTEATGQLDKPALLQWKVGKILDKCHSTNANEYFDLDGYKKIILNAVAKEAEKAPKLGSEIHDELEQWFKGGADTPPSERIAKTVWTVRDEVGKYDYIAEKSFYHPLGFGGKVDLHSTDGGVYWSHNDGFDVFDSKKDSNRDRVRWKIERSLENEQVYEWGRDEIIKWATGSSKRYRKGIVLDFKTKDTLDVNKMKGYREHIMQLAAYRHGLGIPHADCYNLFISSQDTNIVKLVKYTEKELCDAWEMFKCLLKFWQISNRIEVKL
jgi:hypothetical protein